MRSRPFEIHLHLNENEYQRLKRICSKTGLNSSDALRFLITGAELKERPSRDYRALVRAIDRIGNNLNQLAYIANRDGQLSDQSLTEAREYMKEIRNEIKSWS